MPPKTNPPALSAYIWIIFIACLAAMLVTGAVGLRAIDEHDEITSRMHDKWITSFGVINRVSAGLMDNRNELTLLVQHSLDKVVPGPHDEDIHIRNMRRTAAQVDAEWQAFGADIADTPQIVPLAQGFEQRRKAWLAGTSAESSRPSRASGSPRPWPSRMPMKGRPAIRRP